MPTPYRQNGVLIGMGAAMDPVAIAPGTAAQVLIVGSDLRPVFGAVSLSGAGVTGTLPVENGGTETTTFTLNGVLYGNTTSAIQVTAQGPANSVLTANAGAPVFSATPTVNSLTLASGNLNLSAGVMAITPTSGGAIAIGPFGAGAGQTGEIRFLELAANGTNRVGIQAPDSIGSNYAITLPDAPPTVSGQVFAATTGGVASWVAMRAIITCAGYGVLGGATEYLGTLNSATEDDSSWPSPYTGTIEAMYTHGSVNVGVGNTWTFTLRVNGSDTAITHQVSGASKAGSSTGSVAVTAGQQVSIKIVASASAATANHKCTLALRPTA